MLICHKSTGRMGNNAVPEHSDLGQSFQFLLLLSIVYMSSVVIAITFVFVYSFLPSSEQDIRQRLLSSIRMNLAAFLKYRIINKLFMHKTLKSFLP